MEGRGEVIVLSSNNYLGLAGHPEVVRAGIEGLERYGAGTASVRFICGTFEPHLELERELASFSGTEAALTYVSCWNANEAVIPTLTDERTAIFSDELNHASIIDAIRLARPARKVIYPHADMTALRDALRACDPGMRKLIVTDGVFSMEGDVAPLPDILELARAHDAVVIVDDSHGVGVLGAPGGASRALRRARRGRRDHRHARQGARRRRRRLRRRAHTRSAISSRNGPARSSSRTRCRRLLPAARCARSRFSRDAGARRPAPREHALLPRALREIGFEPLAGEAAIIPIIVGETAFAIEVSRRLLERGVFVTGFGYPVVPEGTARVRVQMSAAHEREQLERALEAFQARRPRGRPARSRELAECVDFSSSPRTPFRGRHDSPATRIVERVRRARELAQFPMGGRSQWSV